MEAEVLNFLTRLATEPELYSAWLRDPQAAMKQHGLDDKSQKALAAATPCRCIGRSAPRRRPTRKAAEKSMERAKQVSAILESDPAGRAVAAEPLLPVADDLALGTGRRPPAADRQPERAHGPRLRPTSSSQEEQDDVLIRETAIPRTAKSAAR